MTDDNVTVFVVDDDQAVRDSMAMLMRSVGWSVEVFSSARAFLDAYDSARPGCLILDVRMPEISGLELQQTLRARDIRLPIIMITGHGDVPVAVQAMKNGALDFLQKPFSQQMLLERIKEAVALDAMIRAQVEQQEHLAARMDSLTPREKEVMDLVVAGRANKQIAMDLDISKKTVEAHRARVMQKMEAESLAELVAQAIALGAQGRGAGSGPPAGPRAVR